MFPCHRVPDSNLSRVPRPQGSRIHRCHVPRPQVSTINPQSCFQDTGVQNETSVVFPGNRLPETNLSHVPWPESSRIKPQSCCQATGFHHQTSEIFPGHTFPEFTDIIFPGHRVPESILSYVPRLQVSRIKTQLCSQYTEFQNQGSVWFPGHSIPQPKKMSYSQATGFQNRASVMFPGHRDPDSNLIHVARP